MKNKILITFCFFILFSIFPIVCHANYLNQLDFKAQINEDGSMNVVETWNIDIEDTNTLFKSFETDENQFTGITDVKVTNITKGQQKKLKQINKYMYHVTKDCYYGLKNPDGNFEIAWNVDLENDSETRTYQVEYKVLNVITKYSDYAQLYWQFLGDEAAISASKITGTILLPKKDDAQEDMRVWLHTKDLNGTIYATSNNKVEWEINHYRSGRFVEVRVLFPTEQIVSTKRNYDVNILNNAVIEETEWADEANRTRELTKRNQKLIGIGAIVVSIVIGILFATKITKYYTKLLTLNKLKPTQELKYYRDLPDEKATPGEALFLKDKLYISYTAYFGNVFSATLLDLTLKKYLALEMDSTNKGKDTIQIKILNRDVTNLKADEEAIFSLVIKAAKDEETLTIKELEKYIKNHSSSIQTLIDKVHKSVKNNLIHENCFDDDGFKENEKYTAYSILYFVFGFLAFLILPLSIPFLIDGVLCYKIKNRTNILTQKGLDYQEMWKGLERYMKDFSLLKEKEIPALALWEKYLVYATAFGIADKVLKQLKMVYPNIDQLDSVNTSTYMYFMYHSNFNTNFSNVINTSIASAVYSSGGGYGGGASGGGGFGGGGRRYGRKIISF